MLKFELIIPAYNEEENLSEIISRAANAARENGFTPETFNLVVVDNGSTDGTSHVLKKLGVSAIEGYFRVLKLEKNLGYGHGVWEGLQSTTAPFVGWTHGDLQCDPCDAFRALEVLQSSSEQKLIVKGTRSGRNWKDVLVSRVFERFARLFLGLSLEEINAQPKVFRRELLAFLKTPPLNFSFDLYVLYRAMKNGYVFKTIPVVFPPRIHGTSKWASNFLSRYKTILGTLRYMKSLRSTEGKV